MRYTKIVCTIGPASRDPDTIDALVAAGMDVARLNFSHGTHSEHAEIIHRMRDSEPRWGRPIAILQDLQGPKIRLGTFGIGGGERVDLESGQRFTLTTECVPGTARRASVIPPDHLKEVVPGDKILMDDGLIQLTVEKVTEPDVHCLVIAGGRLSDHKGVSISNVPAPVSCLTPKDRADLLFGIEHGIDLAAISFVRSPADIEEVRAFLRDHGAVVPLVAKIERHEALDSLPEILKKVGSSLSRVGDFEDILRDGGTVRGSAACR